MKTLPLTALLCVPLHVCGWQNEPNILWNRPTEKAALSLGPRTFNGTDRKQPAFAQVERSKRTKRPRTPIEVKLLRRHEELEHGAFQPSKFNLQVDPWGVDKQQSHLSLPSWAFTDAAEQRHLAAMKVVLGRDLEVLEQKTITFSDGRTVKVTEAFPDVYGDFRMLRFLRKDKVQDPVTAAVRYRQFLQWREDNNVDEIRLQIEERLRRGESNVFVPPTDLQRVSKYLPCTIKPLRSCNGLVPVVLDVGEWDTKGLTKLIQSNQLSIREFLAYWIHIYEALNLHLYQESYRTKQLVSVEELCDLNGLTLAHISHSFVSHVLKPWIEMTQSNYPETTTSIVFLRPPRMFSLIWKFFSPLFSKGTIQKVSTKPNFDTSNLSFCPYPAIPEDPTIYFPKTTVPEGSMAVLI